ncbi:MAG: L-aspartate oxidase [Anaerolineales bacterium]
MFRESDVLVIGAGIAGATTALQLARDPQRQIAVITRARRAVESNTLYAQGGIAGRGPGDSAALLAADILRAGAGLSLPAAAHLLAEEGPPLVRRLLVDELGVPFSRDTAGDLIYTLEGGHSVSRVLHVQDATGRAIEKALIERLEALPNVTLHTSATAVEIITSDRHLVDPLSVYRPVTAYGAYVLDRERGEVVPLRAPVTVLAAGGLSNVYLHSSNPKGARGDGVALAHRAGARIVNAEYVQFHPTTLAPEGGYNFLISEAVRGEGARLYTPDGRHFMESHAPEWQDLAPRDVVARAIHQEMAEHGYPHVLLDLASAMPAERIRRRFPNIVGMCRRVGIDPTQEPIPVVPAAHYFCGGVRVDDRGRTGLEGLYAVGEVSCTGVHGANRLASTSLLEGLLWGYRAAEDIATRPLTEPPPAAALLPWTAQDRRADPERVQRDIRSLQEIMWLYVGLARTEKGLRRAVRELEQLGASVGEFYAGARLDDDLIALRNMVEAAQLVARAALANPKSRGAHYRADESTAERSASASSRARPGASPT